MKSMTGYGRGKAGASGLHIIVEIQSVNRRHLEISTHLPRSLSPFESDARHFLQTQASRGHLTVRAQALFEHDNHFDVHPNLALAKELKKGWDNLRKELGGESFKLEWLKDIPELFTHTYHEEKSEKVKEYFLSSLEKAFSALDKMRKTEGKELEVDKKKRIQLLKKAIVSIEEIAPQTVEKMKDKLRSRIQEFVEVSTEDERLLKEIAIFAERVDITEEIVRFKAHLKSLEKETSGKTLEFILQELGREINTIGSKSQDFQISQGVIAIKSELEKLKEQAQNVE
jgi:uncharacterized protein (TIGR00255 family)